MALRLKSGSKGNRRELIEENIFLWGMFVKNFVHIGLGLFSLV